MGGRVPARGGHSVLRPATMSRSRLFTVKTQFTWSVMGLEGYIEVKGLQPVDTQNLVLV